MQPVPTIGTTLAFCAGLAVAASLPAPTHAQTELTIQLVADGFEMPVAVDQPAGEGSRLFVAERVGRIWVVENGLTEPVPFLDISDLVVEGGTKGLLNFLFHPDYDSNGFFYVYYTLETEIGESHRLERYRVPDPDSYVVDPASATTILGLVDEGTGLKFNGGGGMAWGPDGKLYLALGDLRGEFEGFGCTAQDGTTLAGKVVRLNDDGSIPADNPFVDDPGVRDEIWAFGLRQPFRLDVDPVTGRVFIGDVGEVGREEVDVAEAGDGGINFGWRVLEGSLCTDSTECAAIGCAAPGFAEPLVEYGHFLTPEDDGCCVIGGLVYRGTELPWLDGVYIYGDRCTGRIWTLDYDGQLILDHQEITQELAPLSLAGSGVGIDRMTSFGRDRSGEAYVVDSGPPGGGQVFKIVPRTLGPDLLSVPVASGGVQTLSLHAGANQAGRLYFLLGSASGTFPGLDLGAEQLPLEVPDVYFDVTLTSPNAPPLGASLGLLDANGSATATVGLPPLEAGLAGLELSHAFLVLDFPGGSGQVTVVSNSVGLLLE